MMNFHLYMFALCLAASTFPFFAVQADHETADFESIKLTTCNFNATKSAIQCNSTLGSQECQVLAEGIPRNFTLYAIGEAKAANIPQELVWFRIYPRKEDNSGWWFNEWSRGAKFSIHPKEKHSVSDIGFIVTDRICWNKMHVIIRASESFEIIKTEKWRDRKSVV